MTGTILAAAVFCAVVSFIHIVSIAFATVRFRKPMREPCGEPQPQPAVSIVRPLCGIDNYADETLRSCSASRPRRIPFCRWCAA
jgi:ceramide glucosyltransferase